jgi:hypothetical protein
LQGLLSGLRILARIEVRNGYVLVAPRPPYLFLGGEPVLDRELVEDVWDAELTPDGDVLFTRRP